jgi:hypothetical protein
MATHSKASLDQMAQVAARDFIDKGTDLNEGVYKVARAQGLNEEQVGTVCRRANHHVNAAHMKKEAYTTFPVARPEEVMDRMGQEKRARLSGLLDIAEFEGEEKTASFDTEDYAQAGRFQNLAHYYGADLTFTGDKAEDAARFVKAAEIIATRALEQGVIHKTAMDQATDDFYGEVRRELLGGRRLDDLVSEMKKNGQYPMLKKVWSRLEADALVPVSHRDDAGPYSLQRMYKQADFAPFKAQEGKTVFRSNTDLHAAMEDAFKGYNPDEEDELDGMERVMKFENRLGVILPDEIVSKPPAEMYHAVAKSVGITPKPLNIPNLERNPQHAVGLTSKSQPSTATGQRMRNFFGINKKAAEVNDLVDTLLGREVMAADAPILKYAAAYEQARKEFAVDTKAALLCVEGLRRLDKIGGFIQPDDRALALSKEAAGRVMEVAKRLGKFQRLA